MELPGKKVAILGLGKSGFASALFLHEKGFQVFATDQAASSLVAERAHQLREKGMEAESGQHTRQRILDSDWAVISPGIPPTAEIYQALRQRNIPVYSEIEVASWYSASSRIIAVTGSAGKTTVTTLLTRLLQAGGHQAISCGNIGNPWIGELKKINKNDFVVLEVSSFQLEHCESFRPSVGILLNLAPNHQDWHADMAAYVDAKLRLFQNQQPEDYAVIRESDRCLFFPRYQFRAEVIPFGESKKNPNEEVVGIVGGLFGCSQANLTQVLLDFEGIEHRLERVAVHEGIAFVNDSKSTTAASLAWALKSLPDSSVVLIAGGHPKSTDFASVSELLRQKVKQAVLIGEAKPLLREAWEGVCPLLEAGDLTEAVRSAHQSAHAGDTILLSPACASFDMFQNYEDRGRQFKRIVKEIIDADQQLPVRQL